MLHPLARIALLLMLAACCSAQDLTQTMTRLDAAVFDAYNQCRLAEFGSFFAEDVEFYHDQSGLMTGRQNLVDAVEKNICGKVRRGLVSIEMYPMKGYGAVVKGVHRFYPASDPKAPATGEAKFFHLWQFKDGQWKMTRVVSYDHVALKQRGSGETRGRKGHLGRNRYVVVSGCAVRMRVARRSPRTGCVRV